MAHVVGGVVVQPSIDERWLAPIVGSPPILDGDEGLEIHRAVVVNRLPPALRALIGRGVVGLGPDGPVCGGAVVGFEVVANSALATALYLEDYYVVEAGEDVSDDREVMRDAIWRNEPVLVARLDGVPCARDVVLASDALGGITPLGRVPADAATTDRFVALARAHGLVATQELDYHDALLGGGAAPARWDDTPATIDVFGHDGVVHAALVQLGNHVVCAVPPAWFLFVVDGDDTHISDFGVGVRPTPVALVDGALTVLYADGDARALTSAEGVPLAAIRVVDRGHVSCDRGPGRAR